MNTPVNAFNPKVGKNQIGIVVQETETQLLVRFACGGETWITKDTAIQQKKQYK
jgi:hypothetical protein